MNLQELIERHGQRPEHSVPDWMLGFWKRYSISFANGYTDMQTHVCWLQSRNFTIDLRLPLELNQVPLRPLNAYSEKELQCLANYEGWTALSDWDGTLLSWRDTQVSYQLHNRWPEPAILKRTGNCMIEHCPSNAYVEDWRLQPSHPGMLVGLQLIDERDASTGEVRHRGGALIVCGDYAGWVLGRPVQPEGGVLKHLVSAAASDPAALGALLNFETSVGRFDGNCYKVIHSTRPGRVGEALLPLTGFSMLSDGTVLQRCEVDGVAVERRFSVDTLEPEVTFELITGFTDSAAAWYAREAPTLTRYLDLLR